MIGQTKKVEKNKKSKTASPIELANKIYLDNIRTVKFHPEGLPTAEPIVNLNSSTKLVLRFDDVDLDVKNYTYTIKHCNKDWTENDELNSFDYMTGFDEDLLRDYSFSRSRYSDYVHYTLVLPNDRIQWKLSGNYVLKVYDDDDEKELCLTRRFMVVDNKVFIKPEVRVAFNNGQRRTHQEVDFDIDFQGGSIQNPQAQVTATIVQNAIWNKAIVGVKPLFIKNDQLGFNYQNKIAFEAAKEYRFVDIRSLDNRLNFVETIEESDQGFDLLVKKEEPRAHKNYFNSPDADGKFVIQNFDHISFRRLANQIFVDTITAGRDDLSEEQLQERRNLTQLVDEINLDDQRRAEVEQNLSAEYVLTYFTLEAEQPVYGGEVYLFGELTDWRINDTYRMDYNSEELRYEAEILLKQGYYNYMYAFQKNSDKKTQNFTFEEVEGNWFETDNTYHVFIYYRPFGQRYDQLIGYKGFNRFSR